MATTDIYTRVRFYGGINQFGDSKDFYLNYYRGSSISSFQEVE
jgi:hypothetical protein